MIVRRHPILVSMTFLVLAGAVAFSIAWGGDVVVTQVNLDRLPRRILELEGRDDRFEESVYQVLNADVHLLREYRDPVGRSIWLYVGYYGTAKGGRPSHVPQACYTGQGFSIVEWTKVPAPIPDPMGKAGPEGTRRVNQMHVTRGNDHQLVLFWYQSKDRILADGIEQNLHRLKNRLLYNRDDGAFVRLSTTMDPDNAAEALGLLQHFAGEMLKLLPAYWPEEGTAQGRVSRAEGDFGFRIANFEFGRSLAT